MKEGKQEDQGTLYEQLKEQFLTHERHPGGTKHSSHKHNKRSIKHKSRIAVPGQLTVSLTSVAPNPTDLYALQQCAHVLNELMVWRKTTTGLGKVCDMAPAIKWKWCINKIIVQNSVQKMTDYLNAHGYSNSKSKDSKDSGESGESSGSVGTVVPPLPVSTVGRVWDDWLTNELFVLKNVLMKGDITEQVYQRRYQLLELRWSANV